MKKILLILCALVCGTLAFAQSYTDNLHLIVNGDDEGVKQGTVTVEFQNQEKTVLDFTLHDFSVDVYIGSWMTIDLGNIKVYDIELGEENDGVAQFSCEDDTNVDYSEAESTYASLISKVTVNMTGDISETKLHAAMNITVSILIFGDYPVTANFGYDNDYGEYLIVNTATGNYLGGGLDWGTHATEIGKPQFFSITDQPGGYYIYGNQGGFSIGYPAEGTELYVDGANPLAWEFIEADGGYYIACDDGYLTGHGLQEAVTLANTTTTATVWKFVTKDEVIATMDGASISDPVDVTALIPAPEPKNGRLSLWVATGYGVEDEPANYAFGSGGGTANCAESYHSTNGFDIRQTISSLPAGYYELTAQAFYRKDGSSTVIPSMYITTGTSATDTNGKLENVHLPLHSSAEGAAGNMEGAYQEFLEGLYPVSLTFIVDEEDEEITVGFESNTTGDDEMWSIFGELGLLYMGTDLPTLTAVEGKMNADVQAAMEAALAAYSNSKTSANYIAAEQAIFDAEESVAYYAEVTAALETKEYEAVLETFDDAGQAAFTNGFYAAYEAGTLTDETIEDGLADACKQQTTAGSDMTYALKNSGEWTHDTASGVVNFQPCPTLTTAHEAWTGSTFGGTVADPSLPLYKEIEDLPAGEYQISFYAFARYTTSITTGGVALAFANDADTEVAEGTDLGSTWGESQLYTLKCKVEEDGILQFGMKSQGVGDWFVAEEYSLIYGVTEEEEDPYIYDITSLLSNPSFEEYEGELTEDETRSHTDDDDPEGSYTGGAYTITADQLTGWDVVQATNSIIGLMTEECKRTDNDFGAPGAPTDGTYMLYLRDSWTEAESTVKQSIVLPAGDYKATVDTKCVSTTGATATLVVGDEEPVALTIHSTMPSAWDTAVLEFSLTENTEVSMGVVVDFLGSNGSFLLDNFQLFSTEEVETVSYDYDVTWALANPSFETDKVVANLTADETRNSYKVTSLTGWDLVAPTHQNSSYPVSDLMTAESTQTDNNFGVPGTPSDGTYMLYLRDANVQQNENHLDDASVMQTITLPAGDYKLTVDSKCVAQSTAAGTVTLVAGEHSKALTIHVTENGSDDTASNPFLASWDNASLTFSLTAEAEVTVGVNIEFTDGSTNYPLSVLLDNFKLYSVDAIEKEISWTMTDAGWGTMILPFAATLEDGLTAYSCAGTEESTDEDGNEITVVSLTEVGQSIAANTPYIVSGTADTYTFTGTPTNTAETYTEGIITGTLVDLAVAKGAAFATDGTQYLLQNHDDEGLAFYAILAATEDAENSANATLDAYHCYLDLSLVTTSARPVALHFPGAGEETGIVAVEGAEAEANGAIYDLSGRRVAKAVKGVYIMNGKKVLVK